MTSLLRRILGSNTYGNLIFLFFIVIFAMVWSFSLLGPKPFSPWETGWLVGDFSVFYESWRQFFADPDRVWLFSNKFSFPLDLSLSLFDPMPIFLLAAGVVNNIYPFNGQYLGYYFMAGLAAQGIFGFLAMRRLPQVGQGMTDQYNNAWPALAVALFFVVAPFTSIRFLGHTALASHWLLAASIWGCIAMMASPKAAWRWLNVGIVFVACGVNPYLGLLVLLNTVICLLYAYRSFSPRLTDSWLPGLIGAAIVSLFLFGFFSGGNTGAAGFGIYSLNVLGPFDGHGFSTLWPVSVADPNGGGQRMEGFQYLGLGMMILIVIALLLAGIKGTRNVKYLSLALLIVALTFLMSLSNVITVGDWKWTVPIPSFVEYGFAAHFRASGRFFWLGQFWLIILCASIILANLKRRLALAVLFGAFFVQAIDLIGLGRHVSSVIAKRERLELDIMPSERLSRRHLALLIYPAWQCDHEKTPGGPDSFEAIGKFVIDQGIATNSFYAARVPPRQLAYHCDIPARLRAPSADFIYLMSAPVYAEYRSLFRDWTCQWVRFSPPGVLCAHSGVTFLSGAKVGLGPIPEDLPVPIRLHPLFVDPDRRLSLSGDEAILSFFFERGGFKGDVKSEMDQLIAVGMPPEPRPIEFARALTAKRASVLAPANSDESFVRAAYEILLGRQPDPGGLASHMAGLAANRDRTAVLNTFLESEEFASQKALVQAPPRRR